MPNLVEGNEETGILKDLPAGIFIVYKLFILAMNHHKVGSL